MALANTLGTLQQNPYFGGFVNPTQGDLSFQPQLTPAQRHAALLGETPQDAPGNAWTQGAQDPSGYYADATPRWLNNDPSTGVDLNQVTQGQFGQAAGQPLYNPDGSLTQAGRLQFANASTQVNWNDLSTQLGMGLMGGAALSAGGALGSSAGGASGVADAGGTQLAAAGTGTATDATVAGTNAADLANINAGTGAAAGGGITSSGEVGLGADTTGATGAASTGTGAIPGDASGITGAGGGSVATTGAGTAAGGTALSRLMNGTATSADYASLVGTGLSTGLGIAGANQQSNASNALANRLFDAGQPSRDRFNASMSPGFDPMSIPGYSGAVDNASQSLLRGLSTQGNPYGNPGGLINANKQIIAGTELPAIQGYQGLNAQAGGFGSLAAGAPGAGQNAVTAGGGVYNAIGSGISNLTNPNPSLAQILAGLNTNRSLS